jgi:plastocyanin
MLAACKGSNNSATGPTASTQVPAGATVVSIVGSSGSASFSPNPLQASPSTVVVWKNNDAVTHHIVLDNGSADLGTLAPGDVSTSLTVASTTAMGYHCTIHPSMVGTIGGSAAAAVTSPDPAPADPYVTTGRPAR